MDTISMNFENCKACNLHGLLLYLLDKMTLKRTDKYNTSSNLSIYYPRKNTKKVTSATTWNDKFELSDGSYFLSGIQEYFNYVFKKHWEKTYNPPIRIYVHE